METIKQLFFLLAFVGIYACQQPKANEETSTVKTGETATEETIKIDIKKTVTFKTKDAITVTGDLYLNEDFDEKPFILLCHQAGFSRGEYLEIAPKLNKMGFNCLAIDQRSGKGVNEVENQTNLAAKAKKLPTQYPDALPDVIAGLDYIKENFSPSKTILWGSSYSASLTFIVGSQYKDKVDAILAFAPGEYFKFDDKKIEDFAKDVEVPVFITSAKKELPNWEKIFKQVASIEKYQFLPKTEGVHGSRALWEKQAEHKEYWEAVKAFLEKVK